jgi:cytidylate kinase
MRAVCAGNARLAARREDTAFEQGLELQMSVITLSRELGSRGDELAMAVAGRLGLRLAGRDLINRAARAAGSPEVALAEIDELGLLAVKPSPAAVRLYAQKVGEVIRELAAKGDLLVVGRGGQMVLAGEPGVLHVRVIAPRSLRMQMVQQRCHIAPEAAGARIDASDKARAAFLRRAHGVRWDSPALYDLVLSMGRVSVEAATDIVCLAAARVGAEKLPAPPEVRP